MRKSAMSLEKKAMDLVSASLTFQDASGQWTLNERKLRSVLEAEGIHYEDIRCGDFPALKHSCDVPPDARQVAVVLVTLSQLKGWKFASHLKNQQLYGTAMAALLMRTHLESEMKFDYYIIYEATNHRSVVEWVNGISQECIVCFEDAPNGQLIKDHTIPCQCGTSVCVGCFVDLLRLTDIEMTVECPNCRVESGAMENWCHIVWDIERMLEKKNKRAVGGLSTAQLAFIRDTFGVDLAQTWRRALAEATAVLNLASDYWHMRGFSNFKDTPAALQMTMYKEIRQIIGMNAKKKVATASADGGGTVTVSSDGCANCGKSFWDKCERKRAPKCPKCKRTAYCNAKCRKRHRKAHASECGTAQRKRKNNAKTHASECRAAVPKRKSEAKKKPKKGGCTPY